MVIKEVTDIPEGFPALLEESLVLNFNFLRKMRDEWASGKNRFERTGEAVFGAFEGTHLVGVCGLNVDPYLPGEQIGRVRHLYVLQNYRKCGVGKLLMKEIIAVAKQHYPKLRLRTDTQAAAGFYESIGFKRVASDSASHELVF